MNGERDGFMDLLASVAHDVKNSITLILSAADEIGEVDGLPERAREALITLQHQGRRASGDLLNILGAFKLERGRPLVGRSQVDCEELLDELVAFNRALLAARGITLSVERCAVQEAYFDRGLVQGTLNSVINNAFRYARSWVRLDCRAEEGFVVFGVEDDGEGYPPKMLETGEATGLKHNAESTSLGLFFARRIAELHVHDGRQGRIALDNCPGSRFEIWLP